MPPKRTRSDGWDPSGSVMGPLGAQPTDELWNLADEVTKEWVFHAVVETEWPEDDLEEEEAPEDLYVPMELYFQEIPSPYELITYGYNTVSEIVRFYEYVKIALEDIDPEPGNKRPPIKGNSKYTTMTDKCFKTETKSKMLTDAYSGIWLVREMMQLIPAENKNNLLEILDTIEERFISWPDQG